MEFEKELKFYNKYFDFFKLTIISNSSEFSDSN